MPTETAPRARTKGLLVQELGAETLVYDVVRNRAHCLNAAAGAVWRSSDGETGLAEIAARLPALGLPADEDVVRVALDRLDRAGLLEVVGEAGTPPAAVSRRDVVRAIALAAGATLLLPAVESITAPLAAQAASCVTNQQCNAMTPLVPNDCRGLPICGRGRSQCCVGRWQGGGRGRRAVCRAQAC